MQTSVGKLHDVYQDNRKELNLQLGAELYRTLGTRTFADITTGTVTQIGKSKSRNVFLISSHARASAAKGG